ALRLVDDSGRSATDGITNDGRLRFDAVAGAVGYEYRFGNSGAYQPLGAGTVFLPAGLAQGPTTVQVRAFDITGNRGPDATLTFVLDTIPPGAVSGLATTADGRVQFQATAADDTYEFRVGDATAYVPLGAATSFIPSGLAGAEHDPRSRD